MYVKVPEADVKPNHTNYINISMQ